MAARARHFGWMQSAFLHDLAVKATSDEAVGHRMQEFLQLWKDAASSPEDREFVGGWWGMLVQFAGMPAPRPSARTVEQTSGKEFKELQDTLFSSKKDGTVTAAQRLFAEVHNCIVDTFRCSA